MMETNQDKAIKWDKSGKGRGNRWRMMRDIVACLALRPMNLMQTQRALLRLRGLTRQKVHQMMMELQDAGDIIEVTGKQMGWATTDRGVHFWIPQGRKAIPAGIVRVLPTMVFAPTLDPDNKEGVKDE